MTHTQYEEAVNLINKKLGEIYDENANIVLEVITEMWGFHEDSVMENCGVED
jgi:hypothetical protein